LDRSRASSARLSHGTAKLLQSEPSSMFPAQRTIHNTFSNHGNHARCAQKTHLCHKI